MKSRHRFFCTCVVALLSLWTLAFSQQPNKKPYTDWSKQEVKKFLEDSAWAQTQVFSDTSHMFDSGRAVTSGENREINVFNVNFRIRLLSAKPVREAITRGMELDQKGKLGPELAAKLKAFAAADFPDYIVVSVLCDSDRSSLRLSEASALLFNRTTADLKNNTYLEWKGQRVFLQEYQPPRNDGLGARFVFPRIVDGHPFITSEDGELKFYSELSGGRPASSNTGSLTYTINQRFKVSALKYNGKLEY